MKKIKKSDKEYFFLLERTVRQFRKFSQRELLKRGLDISEEQWILLKFVEESPGITQREIADSTYKDPASVTRMIDLLEKRKFLERKSSPDDRRSYGIYLREEGQKFVNTVLPLTKEMRDYGLKNVSDTDKRVFLEVLNTIYKNLE